MKTTSNAQATLLVFGAAVLAVVIFMADARIMSQPQPAAEAPAPQAAPTEATADLEAVAKNAQNSLSAAADLADQLAKVRSQLPSLGEFAAKAGAPTMNGSELPPTPEPIDTTSYQANITSQAQSEIAQKVAFRESLNQPIETNIDEKGVQWVLGPGGWFQCGRIGVSNGKYYYVDGDGSTSADWWDAQSAETILNLVNVCHGMSLAPTIEGSSFA
jgi:hypothetical protein